MRLLHSRLTNKLALKCQNSLEEAKNEKLICNDGGDENGDVEMKMLTRILAAFIAGIFFLGGVTLVLSWATKLIESSPVGIGGLIIVAIALYLFFVGYKGKVSF